MFLKCTNPKYATYTHTDVYMYKPLYVSRRVFSWESSHMKFGG